MGAGKSRLARALAPRLGPPPPPGGAALVRSDEVRKRLAGVAPTTRLPPEAYTRGRDAAVHAALFGAARDALAAGRSAVLDAAFLDPAVRAAAEATARGAGVPFAGLWLVAPLGVLRARVAARVGDASDAGVAVLERAARADPGPFSPAWHRLDAADDPLPEALSILRAHLM